MDKMPWKCMQICVHMRIFLERKAHTFMRFFFSPALDPKMFRTISLHSSDLVSSQTENIPPEEVTLLSFTL